MEGDVRTRQSDSQAFQASVSGPGLDAEPRPLIGPDGLMDQARAAAKREDDEHREAKALVRRLVVAFVLMVFLMAAFIVLVGELDVYVPPIVFLLSFVAIAVGSLLTVTVPGSRRAKPPTSCGCTNGEGRPVGCCSGPRPLRAFRDR